MANSTHRPGTSHPNPRVASSPGATRARRALLVAATIAVCALQVALTAQTLPWARALSSEPITGADYDTHIGQAYRLIEGLSGWGETWTYDVTLLAGHPADTIFDGDNKGWGLFTYLLWALGVPKGTAFNLFVLGSALLSPVIVMGSARLLRLSGPVAVVAGALSVCLWQFDSFVRWLWWVGMNAFAFGAVLLLLPLAMFIRLLDHPRWWLAGACGLVLGLTHLVHPYVFFILAPAMGGAYLARARGAARAAHAQVVLVAALTIAINARWIAVALAHWQYVLDSAFFVQGGVATLVADLFNLLVDPTDTGVIGTRTGFRFLTLALSGVGMWCWRRQGDPRLLPLGLAIGTGIGFAYLGRYVPLAGQMQPYRHVVPAAFVATLPAAWALVWVAQQRPLRALAGPVRAVAWIAVAGTGLHLATDAEYFLAQTLPTVRPMMEGDPSPLGPLGHADHIVFSLPHPPHVEYEADRMARWIHEHIEPGQRLLVEDIALGERVAWQSLERRSGIEVIGGFRERNVVHAYANLFRPYQGKVIPEARLRAYLRTYAIDWVIAHQEHAELDGMTETLELAHEYAGRRIFRNRLPHPRVLNGPGRVQATTNRLDVSGADPAQDVVLSYHHHPALECRPDCQVDRFPIELDRAGLIRVRAPHPARFTIVNSYRLGR